MKRKTMNEPRETSGFVTKIISPILGKSGKTSTSIAGVVIFALGIGLTLFIIANPMKVGVFDKVTHVVLHREGSGLIYKLFWLR